ncbi:hypothetical protein [Frankia sp. R43]|uniref:hypothetical protein n=1 Tax=Frankia sp. R43 TaxID=269536 RepID=UPI00128F2755|nr:hypothetical protein [Frankia sp. R43]
MLHFIANAESFVWSVQLCHGDWDEGPRVVVGTALLSQDGIPVDRQPDDPVTNGTLDAFVVIANSPGQNSSELGANMPRHLAAITADSTLRPVNIDGIPHSFKVSVFRGEQIGVARLPGDIAVFITARGVSLDDIELGEVDLTEYGIDPTGPMHFHIDRQRSPALYQGASRRS